MSKKGREKPKLKELGKQEKQHSRRAVHAKSVHVRGNKGRKEIKTVEVVLPVVKPEEKREKNRQKVTRFFVALTGVVSILMMIWIGASMVMPNWLNTAPDWVKMRAESDVAESKLSMEWGEGEVKIIPIRGKIYLTFDDGPGPYTAQLLDVLRKYGAKATFFVTGAGDDELIAREYAEGHAVGLHTLSHNYAHIYQDTDNFFADLVAVQERVERITGEKSYLMRFPGGSSNLVSRNYDGGAHIMSQLTAEVEERGFTYFDWNVSSGDAGEATTADEVYENVVNRLVDGGETVVLQHDIKGFSVEAVERILQYGITNGYKFERLDAGAFTAHHEVNN